MFELNFIFFAFWPPSGLTWGAFSSTKLKCAHFIILLIPYFYLMPSELGGSLISVLGDSPYFHVSGVDGNKKNPGIQFKAFKKFLTGKKLCWVYLLVSDRYQGSWIKKQLKLRNSKRNVDVDPL